MTARHKLGVMRGLDPRIHEEAQPARPLRLCMLSGLMDCRVKPGNDNREGVPGCRLDGRMPQITSH